MHCFSDDNGGGGGNASTEPPTDSPTDADPRCANAPQSSGFNDGDGLTEDTPFLICTYAQLGMMGDDLSAHYELGDNIDASSSDWVPVGDGDTTHFSGTLSGRAYVIRNLNVNTSADYAGLFGSTTFRAKIRNVGLRDVNVEAGDNTGGLVGSNNGDISNSYATGTVSGANNVGGLVGYNDTGDISSSYATVSVSGTTAASAVASGLVGNNSGNISNSYATGTVTSMGGGRQSNSCWRVGGG